METRSQANAGGKAVERPAFLRVITDPTEFTSAVPDRARRHITRRELQKNGFVRVSQEDGSMLRDDERWQRSYSGIVTLEYIFRKGDVSYRWHVDRKALNKACDEMEAIARLIKEKARIMRDVRAKRSKFHERTADLKAAWEEILRLKKEFSARYKNFLHLYNFEVQIQTPHLRSECFFFDAFETKADLHAFFRFIELFKRGRGTLVDSPRKDRRISPDAIKGAIFSYHFGPRMVDLVRSRFQAGASTADISREVGLPEEIISDMTEDAGPDRKGWKMKPTEFATSYAASHAGTTEGNFRQILKLEKSASASVRERVRQLPVADFLAGRVPAAVVHEVRLKSAIIPQWQWDRLFEWSMAAFSSEGGDEADEKEAR